MKNCMQYSSMYSHIVLCICYITLDCIPVHLYIPSMWNSGSSPAGCQTVQHLRSARPTAVWLLLTECHDPEISAFSLTGGFEISGLKVLWDYISEGFCHDGSWQVLLSSGWRNSAERLSCRELHCIKYNIWTRRINIAYLIQHYFQHFFLHHNTFFCNLYITIKSAIPFRYLEISGWYRGLFCQK